MSAPLQFPFQPRPNGSGPGDLVPLLPVTLTRGGVSVDVTGLVDTGSTFSVLPYDVGMRFGVTWHALPAAIGLAGPAGPTPAKLLALDATIGSLAPVTLLFAWASSNAYPVLFGQANFFMEFDVFLFRRQGFFQIQPATP
jgi:hypothetical protein